MANYRDDFDTHPRIHPNDGAQRASFTGPLIVLGVILTLILGILLTVIGTDNIDINADSPSSAAATAPVAPESDPLTR